MASNNEKIYDEFGSLLLFNKATKEDIDLLMTLLCRGPNEYIQLLRSVVKDDTSLIKLFEKNDVECWIAPRNIRSGKSCEKIKSMWVL